MKMHYKEMNREHAAQPELIMLVGIPGCGKSTYAEKMSENGYQIISSDALRKEVFGDESIQGKSSDIFRELSERTRSCLKQGISCVVDATNLTRKRRKNFLANVKHIPCSKKCVVFVVPAEECLKRNQQRERTVEEDVIINMIKSFQCPFYYEGWDVIEIVHDENWNYQFPFEVIEDFSQDNIHHTLSLGGHIHKAEEYCREQGFSEFVQLAAAYHDCGKLYTKTYFNMKGEKSEHAHFYAHENYSAYLFLNEMYSSPKYKTYSKDEILYMTNLINWHMHPLNSWQNSQKARENDRKMMGEEMYQDLLRLNAADRAAH